ncbi:MAG: Gldg family protein [Deltaproteobacteria bacterium]
MSHILSIAKKELRGYFLSPVALIFLGLFLLTTLGRLFNGGFFARGIADIRPLFELLPVSLIYLCSALTMRLWSEEEKLGTLEVLLTMPVEKHRLVLGKFLAALALTAIALVLTFSVPVTVAMLGPLDWGPVIGGYVGAVLMAGAYLAIGMFFSSITSNQIVALTVSTLVCSILFLVGEPIVVDNVGNNTAELLTAIGTGSRFRSILRGVLDIRDLVYYVGIVVVFLGLNTLLLRAKGWSEGARTASRRHNAIATVLLLVLNVLAINVVLSNATGIRVDMTERGEYSISKVTKDLVRSLDEPLLIRGYFSEKTHPLLAPMVPRIRDMIEEYGEISGGKVVTEYVDPREDVEMEKEANQLYGIKSFPFQVADRLDTSVVNSYFSILIKYGDQFQVLTFQDLIEVSGRDPRNIEVKLRNLEYDLTRAIKKVAYGFQTLEAVLAELANPAKLSMYVTAASLPENFQETPGKIEGVLKKMSTEANGKFEYVKVDPDAPGSAVTRDDLAKLGLRPYATLFSQTSFYLHLVLDVDGKLELIPLPEPFSAADFEKDVKAALERSTPGFLKTVGLSKPKSDVPENLPPQLRAQMPPPPPDLTRAVTKQLSETYTVETADLTTGKVDGAVDVLVVFAPKDYDEKQRFAIDQQLMKGGTVIVVGGKFELDTHGGQSVKINKITTGLEEQLASYGVELGDVMVMDPQNEPFAMPVERDLGGMRVREIQYLPYPFFPNVRSDGMADDTPVVGGLPGVTVPWATALTVNVPEAKEGEGPSREATVLLQSSPDAWTTSDTNVQPDFKTYPEAGFAGAPGETKRHALGVLVTGSFDSFFKGKKDPTGGGAVLEQSPASARLVVIGSSAFANDVAMSLSRQAASNLELVQNLVDWGVEDVDLLSIRSRGTFARTLAPIDKDTRLTYELANYGVATALLALIVVLAYGRRRRLTPIDLDTSAKDKVAFAGADKSAVEA